MCSGQEFRRSRLRNDDITHLLLLTYPVRCLRCSERQYVSLVVAALSISSNIRQPKPTQRRSNAPSSQTNWSEPSDMVLRSQKEEPPAS